MRVLLFPSSYIVVDVVVWEILRFASYVLFLLNIEDEGGSFATLRKS